MSILRAVDFDLLDDLFEMRSGYVLDFNDRTYGDFFRRELGLNVDEPRYALRGTSKAKRLRCLLLTTDNPTAIRVLTGLWDYRETKRQRARREETFPDAEREFWDLIARPGGTRRRPAQPDSPPVGPDRATLSALGAEFVTVSQLEPQQRGYAFERSLKALFDAYGLDPRSSFRNVGEQIDGSFQIRPFTYLVEARWREAIADAAALHAFHGKLDQKADWSRGLFISMAGFSTEGLVAFGRAKKLICMDGLDLYETLTRGLPFDEVIERKVRRAVETGKPFIGVRDLF